MTTDDHEFDPANYDHHGRLKTPPLVVVALAFLSRYPLVLVLSAFSSLMLGRRGIRFEGLGLPPLDALASGIPAVVLLLVVLLREKFEAKAWSRLLLRRGVSIGVAVALLQLVLDLRMLLLRGHQASMWIVIDGLLLVYCAAYLLRSHKAANYFRTYGAPADG